MIAIAVIVEALTCASPMAGIVPTSRDGVAPSMTESNKTSRVEFSRIEVGVLGNCREKLTKIDELAADIRENGLLQPLLVWHKRMRREPHLLDDGREVWDRYILIAGNRRHAAIARIREGEPDAFAMVPVTLKTGNEDDALFAQIAENLQREDLTPVELANAIYKMRGRGHTQAAIASKLSKSQAFVSRLLKLRERAVPELLRAVADGEMAVDTALVICDLDDAAQAKAVARFLAAKKTDGKAAAGRNARGEAGAIVRPSAKVLSREFEFIVTARKHAPRDQQVILSLAERVLAYALGKGPWPAELPRPEAAPTSKTKRS